MITSYLAHHGVLGMKWGVRRYQNKDGTLTPAGRKRVHDAYVKEMKKGLADIDREGTRLYVDAHNKAVDIANPKLHKFNDDWEKKHGPNSFENEEYEKACEKIYKDAFNQQYSIVVKNFVTNNASFIKAHDLVEEYKMQEWSDDVSKEYEEIKYFFDNK